MLNLVLGLVYEIPKLSTIKDEYLHNIKNKISELSKRSENNLNPYFTISQTKQIS
jgi:hypothetical protein